MAGLCLGSLLMALPVRADNAAGGATPQDPGIYPNDAGAAEVDISGYPADIQADYRVFARRCTMCHTIARPLNSQFLQLTPAEQTAAKAKEPQIFNDAKIWKIGDSIWTDYVRKMQSKPGAIIRASEFDKIVGFLVYDSKARKTGASASSWQAQRQKLLDDFKKSNPQVYEKLFAQ